MAVLRKGPANLSTLVSDTLVPDTPCVLFMHASPWPALQCPHSACFGSFAEYGTLLYILCVFLA